MSDLIPAVLNWSGGKDSMLALHYILRQKELDIRYLLTTVHRELCCIAMHGVSESLLSQQVAQIGLPLLKVELPEMPDMLTYETIFDQQLAALSANGITHSIYGDIFLEDLKLYRETQLAKHNMHGVFPLWKKESISIIHEFIDLGYQTIVVCAQSDLKEFCGRIIDRDFLKDLPKGIDPCGENGEFHTFVFDGPIFNRRVEFKLGDTKYRSFPNPDSIGTLLGFWYIDLQDIK